MKLTAIGPMDDIFAREVPYLYPIYGRWDVKGIPHAIFCRHARNLHFHNPQVEWGQVSGLWMSALRCEEVENLDLDGFVARQAPSSDSPAVALLNVRGASLRGCRAEDGIGTFLGLEGSRTEKISIAGNDLAAVGC